MKKRKICLYAICKNEEKFVDRFIESIIKEIPSKDIYILDTGSTDNTIELFKKHKVHIEKKVYKTFNFDVARNDSLSLVPEDYEICICLDIDDVIEKGFVKEINTLWQDDTSILYYDYFYKVDDNNNPIIKFKNNHIHSRKNWKWKNSIHEILAYTGNNFKSVTSQKIKVYHKPDITKSREFYLELLEEEERKNPKSKRNLYLLTREYSSRNMPLKCLETGHTYLQQDVNFMPEICKVMCYISKAYRDLKWYDEAVLWGEKAIKTYSHLRDGYLAKLIANYYKGEYEEAIKTGKKALRITDYDEQMYSDAACWDGTIYDFLSLSFYKLKDYSNAVKMVNKALKQNPTLKRLQVNKQLFVDLLEKNKH